MLEKLVTLRLKCACVFLFVGELGKLFWLAVVNLGHSELNIYANEQHKLFFSL